MKGEHQQAGEVLRKIGLSQAEEHLAAIRNSVHLEIGQTSAPLFVRSLSKPISLAVAVAMFNQLGGINALWYYANTIFAMAGFSKDSSALQSVMLGVANLIATLVGMERNIFSSRMCWNCCCRSCRAWNTALS